jgi:hypothetical protein
LSSIEVYDGWEGGAVEVNRDVDRYMDDVILHL